MQCKTVLIHLDAMRTGEIETVRQNAVEEHLETCGSCADSRHDVDALADVVKLIAPAVPKGCCHDVKKQCIDSFDRIATDAGDVFVAFSDAGIRMVLPANSEEELRATYAKRFSRVLRSAALPEALRRQVLDALNGEGVSTP